MQREARQAMLGKLLFAGRTRPLTGAPCFITTTLLRDMQNPSYRLYGADISYYTGKVRAYLRWKALPFDEVHADANVYRQEILPRVGFPVIPVVVTPDDVTLQDTTCIIEALEARHPEPSVSPSTPRQRLASLLLELYGDEWLLIPAMHYRWHHNRDFAIRAFGELNAPHASPDEQLAIGNKRAGPFAQSAVMLGGAPSMHAAIETSYEALLGELNEHFGRYPYLLGTRPCEGDFGLIGPLYAHLYRDPASGELMRRLAPDVVGWVERMQNPPVPGSGDFLSGDEIPDTLIPVLRRMMREQLPDLQNTVHSLEQWMAQHPGEQDVPRSVGMQPFELEGSRGTRIAKPYSLWMLQRVRDAWREMDRTGHASLSPFLEQIDGQAFRDFMDPPRLERHIMSVKLRPS